MKRRSGKRIFLVIGIAIIAVAAAFAAYLLIPGKQDNEQSKQTIASMEELIPFFGTEDSRTGLGRDPLAVLSIDGTDIVGGLEIPSINLRAPVAEKGSGKEFFASRMTGSPVKGHFIITGGRHDVFTRLTKVKPDSKVTFTDIDGYAYNYTVTTQFHKKKWDYADYDLMLCYKIDKNTYFVLACTSE